MRDDGSHWVTCSAGHRHWGRFGAAGVLLRRAGEVLMQHRAEWTAHGGTWSIPGGARDSHETAIVAALRELTEETGIESDRVVVVRECAWDCGGGWTYTTVVGDVRGIIEPGLRGRCHRESTELRWVPGDDVDRLPLHPAFAASWPAIRAAVS